MLKVPAFSYFSNYRVTAFQDDTVWWKFYLIPDYASIRRDNQGHPVCLLVKYAFGDQDRAENKNLPRGGGYIVFDTELRVPEADETKIKAELQKYVDDIWHQLKALADAGGNPVQGYSINSWHYLGDATTHVGLTVHDLQLGLHPDDPASPPGDAPPKVILDMPTWTRGKFRISAPQSSDLVAHRVTEGPVSLIGANVVSANMDLTPAGATFMEKTLTNPDGTGGTDLTPIQVLYEVNFWARTPPVGIDVSADSRSLYMAARQIYHDYEDNGCDEDSITHSDQQLEMAVKAGIIKVKVDAGTLKLTDDFIVQLRSSALKFVQDQIKDHFFKKKEAPPPADDPTKDFVSSDRDIYYLKSNIDFNSFSIAYHEQDSQLVEWSANPQGTMQTFLAGVSASEMKRYVRTVDLDDPFFQTLGLTVTAFADWSEPIAFIETQVHYTGHDENNQTVEKSQAFTFSKDHTTELWDPSLIGKKREFEYRWRVGYLGHGESAFTEWQTANTPKLNLSVANPGKIALKLLVGSIDFTQTTKQVQIDLKSGAPGTDIDEESTTLQLLNGQLEGNYLRYIYKPWIQPVSYRTRFYLKTDQMIQSDWQTTLNQQLLINEPFVDRLRVQLVPVGNWDGVIQTVIGLHYIDEVNNYRVSETYTIKTADEFKLWSVVLRDPRQRKFQYQTITTFKDGTDSGLSAWTVADGDQALPIRVQQHPELKVKLVPDLIDFKVTPLVECAMHYNDAPRNIQKNDTFVFNKVDNPVWDFPLKEGSPFLYRYQVTYHTSDQKTIPEPVATTDTNALVIPPLTVPTILCLVVPKVVDFVQTPVVEVDVEYKDPNHQINYEETLVFTDPTPQSFKFQVKDDSPRTYTLALTYYTADGKVVQRAPVELDKNKVVIPKYVAGS